MSKPIVTVQPHGYHYSVFVGDIPINNTEKEDAENIAATINAACDAHCAYLLSTLHLVQNYFRLLNDPQGASDHMLALARHETEGAVNVAIAMADGKDAP